MFCSKRLASAAVPDASILFVAGTTVQAKDREGYTCLEEASGGAKDRGICEALQQSVSRVWEGSQLQIGENQAQELVSGNSP